MDLQDASELGARPITVTEEGDNTVQAAMLVLLQFLKFLHAETPYTLLDAPMETSSPSQRCRSARGATENERNPSE